ncbi:MAG: HAD family phosphatase, partial [Clostridia bacterium]|nr:HAD family phosphatase [Clostridia bacterium]
MGCIPFKAAIFDLDGTLLDSMYVWSKVDEVFFGRRGMAVPPTYGSEVAGMSYRETAEFTVRKYMPNERWQDLIEEWTRLSEEEYALRVPLKKGSYAYLRMLKREGVRLAIASALTPNLYKPCLKRLGLDELFEVVCSTEHTNGRGKASGEIYLLAASKLGVEPSDCVVFEDALAGIMGAKAVGMGAYAIREPHVAGDIPKIEAMADYTMDCIDEMRNIHPFTTSPRCVIFTAYCEGDPAKAYEAEADDFIVCADAGWTIAASLGLEPALT